MGQIADALKQLIDNPDDLTNLPDLVGQVEEVENTNQAHQERIHKLQQINNDYLSRIPVPTEQQDEPQEQEVTFEDAKASLLNTLKGVE